MKTPGVWNSLARMCVKTRRLDVAGICLGHMGNAKAARALRLATADSSLPLEAKVAVLAIHLDMIVSCENKYYLATIICVDDKVLIKVSENPEPLSLTALCRNASFCLGVRVRSWG